MTYRRVRIALFTVLLAVFSANYFFWAIGMTTGISGRELFGRHPYLTPFAVISQYLRVYDSSYYFSSRNEVRLTFTDGRTVNEKIQYNSFRNPLDALFFFHVWYWWSSKDPATSARKDRFLRLQFCRPGVKSADWKVYYLEDSLTLDLGRTDC